MGYYILAFICIFTTAGIHIYVSSSYNKYKKEPLNKKISGVETANNILEENDINNVYVIETKEELSDNYNPDKKVIRLSSDIFNGENVTSIAVASHISCHAIQYKEGNSFIKVMSLIFPFLRFSSQAGYIIIVVGFIFRMFSFIYVGSVLIAIILVFLVITLPIEFNASKRALENLKKMNSVNEKEIIEVEKVLKATALASIAGLTAIIKNF